MRIPGIAAVHRLLFAIASIATLGACSTLGIEGGTSQRSQLEREKARWARARITDYRFTYSVRCFCAELQPIEVEVRNGAVAEAAYPATDQPLPAELRVQMPTVDSLFAMIDRSIRQRVDLIEVTYDPILGYPTSIAVDRSFNTADDEVYLGVTAFQRLDFD